MINWLMAWLETRWLPDDVAGVDLNGPGAPQVVVVREGVAGGEDASRGFTLEAAAALGYMCPDMENTLTAYFHHALKDCERHLWHKQKVYTHTHTLTYARTHSGKVHKNPCFQAGDGTAARIPCLSGDVHTCKTCLSPREHVNDAIN